MNKVLYITENILYGLQIGKLILLKKNELKTVSLALNMFAGDRFSNFPGMCAAVMIGVLPTMLIYFIFQENIIAGMTAGAVKG